jgi:hypothetical protein
MRVKEQEGEPTSLPYRRTTLDRRAGRKGLSKCPVCCAFLQFTAAGGRRLRCCAACGATYRPNAMCPHCSRPRLWQGNGGMYCQGCGRPAPAL